MGMFDAVSKSTLKKAAEQAIRLKRQVDNIKEKSAEALGHAVQTLEVGSASFGFAYLRGRLTTPERQFTVMNVPIDLLAGFGLHALSFAGAFDKYDEHAHNFGDGALAAYLAFTGLKFGAQSQDPAKSVTIAGELGPAMPTDHDVMSRVAAMAG